MTQSIYIFSIEGNIDSGKSTIVKRLKSSNSIFYNYEVVFLQEPVDIWENIKDKSGKNIIEYYYENNKKYSFQFQMMAYISRIHQLRETINKHKNSNIIIITERSVHTDKNIFAQMLYDSNKMEDIEFQIYKKWFDEFAKDCPIYKNIYIKTDPNICYERVLSRSRKGENIPLSYLQKCHSYHESWLNTNNDSDALILDGNIENNSEYYVSHMNHIVDFIKKNVKDKYIEVFDREFILNHPFM